MAELIDPSNYQDFTLETLRSPDGMTRLNNILRQLAQNISGDTEQVRVYSGVGTPEASVAAGVGSLYMRTDGGADTAVYRKETGSADTGWVAVKSPASLPLSVTNGGLGADNSSQVQGTVLYVSATGVISFLATGTSGQFLKTQGAGANPIWATQTAPALTLVSTTTISAAATTGNINITSGNTYFVQYSFVNFSAADSISLRFNADTGAGHYKYVNTGSTTTGAISALSASAALIQIGTSVNNNTTLGINGGFYINQTGTSSQIYNVWGQLIEDESAGGLTAMITHCGRWTNSANATSFVIFTSGGSVTMTGTVYLYQVSTS